MNIGFVSYWFERGAAYVTRQYMSLLEDGNNLYVYARGANYAIGNPVWDKDYVTWGIRTPSISDVYWPDFKKWIKKNNINLVFFNEQRELNSLVKLREEFPQIVIGSYIDYYRMDTVKDFGIYDFLICNTKRHYSVFNWHPNCYYVPWGTDVDLFAPKDKFEAKHRIRFFHSAGMSPDRKGTDVILDVFLNTDLHELSDLIIHVQDNCRNTITFTDEELANKNITIVEKTVTAPGLFYMGDVYVYPSILDGLGLTMYEALSSGLPVIATDEPPMNEVIDDNTGQLVKVNMYRSREDGYYWPLSYVDKDDLYRKMKYYVDNISSLPEMKRSARSAAVEKYNWNDRKKVINDIFYESKPRQFSKEELDGYKTYKGRVQRLAEFRFIMKHMRDSRMKNSID